MIYSLHALIVRQGTTVRAGIARPATIARYLATVAPLADFQVVYWLDQQPHRVTAEGFLTLYEVGRIPPPRTLKAMTGNPHEPRREGSGVVPCR